MARRPVSVKRIDLHNHSFTNESSSEPEEAIEAAIKAGLDGIAFTEHNSYSATERAEELKEAYSGRLMIFRGVEYDAAEGHVLLFGLTENSFMDMGMYVPINELIRHMAPRGAVVVVAHPFRGWSLFKADLSALNGVCAIEGYNGHNTPEENALAIEAASALSMPTTGGSDSHGKEDVGRCYTEFLDDVTEASLAAALRSGRYRGVWRG